MRADRRMFAMLAVAPLASCSVVGPVVDRSMDDAPRMACARFAEPATPQCFNLYRSGARWEPVTAEAAELRAGDELHAIKSTDPTCAGEFTHLAVAADTNGPGAIRLEIPDAVGRQTVGRTFRWRQARAGRRWAVEGIDTPLHIPGGVTVKLLEGEARLTAICYASYGSSPL